MQNDANNGSLTDKFRDFGAAPSDGLWDSIAAQLDEKKKRRFGFWWWTAGLAATLLLAAGIYFYGSDAETSRGSSVARADEREPNNHTTKTNAPKGEENVSKDGRTPVSPNDTYLHNNRDVQQSVSTEGNGNNGRSVANNPSSNQEIFRANGDFVNGHETDSLRENVAENGGGANKADSLKAVPAEMTPPENDLALHTDSIRNDSSFGRLPGFPHTDGFSVLPSPKWMIGLRTTRWQDNGREPWMGTPSTGELSAAGAADIFGTPGVNGPYIHRHWSLEADIAYNFRYRWWIGSGVHVGHFASERKTYSSAYTNARISAWTIGVPLNLNIDVLSRGRWQVYTGLGVNLDFPLQRKLQYEPGSNAAFSIEESTQPNGYLGSTQLNLGVRCRVWKNLSVDVRPTVRRYFENGAQNGVYVYNKVWWGVAGGVTYWF